MTTWLLSAMVVAVFVCLTYFLITLDTLAANELSQRVLLAKNTEIKYGKDLLEEYSFWDEAYTKIAKEHDAKWIKENSGSYLLSKTGYDFSVAIVGGEKAYFTKTADARTLDFYDVRPSLIDLNSKPRGKTEIVDGFFLIEQEVYRIISAPFVSVESESAITGAYLALGKRIDPEYLSELETNYQLFGLSLSKTQTENSIELRSNSGQVVGYLSWDPNLPSKDIIPLVTGAIILFATMVTFVMRIIIKNEQISRAEYEDQLYLEATTDELTCVYNRRYFMSVGAKRLDISKRLGDGLFTVLVLDIDHFKSVNDKYGHNVGDKALIHFSKTCLTGLRESDILGRIGGEEFAVILPGTDARNAFEVANRIREAIAKIPFVSNGKFVSMTVSIGIAELKGDESLSSLIEKADKALYEAKSTGRNKVVMHTTAS